MLRPGDVDLLVELTDAVGALHHISRLSSVSARTSKSSREQLLADIHVVAEEVLERLRRKAPER